MAMGSWRYFFIRPFVGLETGRFIAAPEALSRFYTDEAHTRVGATWMTREDREHEMADQVEYLDHLVQRLLAECGKPVPVNVLGFSQGVATACRWAVRGKTTFAKAVLWSGTMPPELKPDELKRAFGKTELTLVHGTSDAVTKEGRAAAEPANNARKRAKTAHYSICRWAPVGPDYFGTGDGN
jgi:predicted esterase